jgi:hypothetical protein
LARNNEKWYSTIGSDPYGLICSLRLEGETQLGGLQDYADFGKHSKGRTARNPSRDDCLPEETRVSVIIVPALKCQIMDSVHRWETGDVEQR